MTQFATTTIQALQVAPIAEAVRNRAQFRLLRSADRELKGTLRGYVDGPDLRPVDERTTSVSDLWVRVTTTTGGEIALRFEELVQANLDQTVAFDSAFDVPSGVQEVTIILDGGIVQDVRDQNGEGVPATVHDYDVDGCDPEELQTDNDGNEYLVWGV